MTRHPRCSSASVYQHRAARSAVRESSGVPGAHAPETRAASPRATIIGPSRRVVDANRSVVETGDLGITVDVQASAEARGLAEIRQMILRRTGALTDELSEAGAALTAPVAGMAEAASASRVAHERGEGAADLIAQAVGAQEQANGRPGGRGRRERRRGTGRGSGRGRRHEHVRDRRPDRVGGPDRARVCRGRGGPRGAGSSGGRGGGPRGTHSRRGG